MTVEHAGRPRCWPADGAAFTVQAVAGDELAFPDEPAATELVLTIGDGDRSVTVTLGPETVQGLVALVVA